MAARTAAENKAARDKVEAISSEEYEIFKEFCFNEAKERTGSKLAALNEMQGFDFPDYIETDQERFAELTEGHGEQVPEDAAGVQVLNSCCGLGKWILSSSNEDEIRKLCHELYY